MAPRSASALEPLHEVSLYGAALADWVAQKRARDEYSRGQRNVLALILAGWLKNLPPGDTP